MSARKALFQTISSELMAHGLDVSVLIILKGLDLQGTRVFFHGSLLASSLYPTKDSVAPVRSATSIFWRIS